MLKPDVPNRGWVARWIALLGLLLAVGCAQQPPKLAAPGTPWVAAWGSAQLEQAAPAAGTPELVNGKPVAAAWKQPLRDVTLRQVVRVTAAGTALRVRVSNLFGRDALQLGSASVALLQGEAGTQAPVLQAASQRVLTFDGQKALSLAAGAEAWSDPVELAVPRGADLAVQWHVQSAPAMATVHPGSRIQSWAVTGARTDAAAWPDAAARDGWWHLAAIDVRATAPQPVLAATGDSITDGYGVTAASYQRWTDQLARRLAASGRDAAVVNTGIGGGRLLRDGLGPNLVSRFGRDVLDRSGVTHAVVLIGVNDLGVSHRGRATTPESRAALLAELKAGFTTLQRRARERGVCLLASTVMPYGGSGYYQPQPENEADRQALNDWIRRSGTFDAVLDFDAIARDPNRPTHLRADWDNDGLHPSIAGYKGMAEAFPLDFLQRRCAPGAAPAAAPVAAAMPASFDNPVVSGFASDPSVCRAGDDYYLVTSTFEYLPGLPIYHSRDLVHWRLIGNALTRESQLNFANRRSSRAIFAPTIRCEGGRFYIVTTDVDGIGNFFITADKPTGPWSDPVRLPEPVFGMDPSLFFDDDGTVYYTRHGGGERGGVYQARIDLKAGKLLEEPRLIWRGMGGIWPEGPHLYKRNGWYYVMIAEGGTSYDHRITMGRSRSPWGPFEAHPDNPVLTHRSLPDHPLQALGHADLVMTPKGDWWATLLAIRPQQANGGRHHHIGRETLLAPVRWREDGWPEFGQNKALPGPQPTAGLPGWAPWPQPPVRETFAADRPLPPHWAFLRTLAPGRWSLTARPGQLRLIGAQNGIDVVGTPAFVGRRQEKLSQRFASELDFKPAAEGDAAGLAVRMNESHHLLLRRTGVAEPRVECLQQLAGKPSVLATAKVPAGPLQLQVLAEPATYTLSWRAPGQGDWQPLCTVPTWQLSTETAGGFIGVYLGLYAVSATAAPATGDFAWVDFEALGR